MSSATTCLSGGPLSWAEVDASDCATINEEEFSIVEVDEQLKDKDLTILEAVSITEDERGLTIAATMEWSQSNRA